MKKKNKHRLSRYIPKAIAEEVRKNSKFGCVVCRNALYTYEHIDPIFSEAKEHTAENICLLCDSCHGKVTRGVYSKEKIRNHQKEVLKNSEIKEPFCDFDLNTNCLTILIGDSEFVGCNSIFTVDGLNLLSFSRSEENSTPKLNGHFYDKTGRSVFSIKDNEWKSSLDIHDLTSCGSTSNGNIITIKTSPNTTALKLKLVPPNKIQILELNMFYKNFIFTVYENMPCIVNTEKFYKNTASECVGVAAKFDCRGDGDVTCIDVRSHVEPQHKGSKVIINSDDGITIPGAGISLAKGTSIMYLQRLTLVNTSPWIPYRLP